MPKDRQTRRRRTDRKVECHLGIRLLNIGVEACLLIGLKPVSQGSGTDGGDQGGGQAGEESEPHDAWRRGILMVDGEDRRVSGNRMSGVLASWENRRLFCLHLITTPKLNWSSECCTQVFPPSRSTPAIRLWNIQQKPERKKIIIKEVMTKNDKFNLEERMRKRE